MPELNTTDRGYVNRNQQMVIRKTTERGSDHGQVVYALRCLECGLHYGSNGTDIFQRKCPACQSGAAGLHIPTFLLRWNKWPWADMAAASAATLAGGSAFETWPANAHTQIRPGHRVVMTKHGREPRGLMASGYVVSPPELLPKWDNPDQNTYKVNVEFDTVLDPRVDPPISIERLNADFPSVSWEAQGTGTIPKPPVCAALELAWAKHVQPLRVQTALLVEVAAAQPGAAPLDAEGRRLLATHCRYERSRANRESAIATHGTICKACAFDFNAAYGPDLARDYVQVHHARPLPDLAGSVPRVEDLVPLCANCHAMAHRDPHRIVPLAELQDRVSRQRAALA